MQKRRRQPWHGERGPTDLTAAADGAGWRRDERFSLLIFLGVLFIAVASGSVFWWPGAFAERQTEQTVASLDREASKTTGSSAMQVLSSAEKGRLASDQVLPPRQNVEEDSAPNSVLLRGRRDRAQAHAAKEAQAIQETGPSPRRHQIAQAMQPKADTDDEPRAKSSDQPAAAEKSAGGAGPVEPAWIAGVEPGQRPAGAPVIRQMEKKPGWYSRALTGTTRPYPESFKFLEDQEAWYTPFSHPGMTGPYDLRGWHAPASGEGS